MIYAGALFRLFILAVKSQIRRLLMLAFSLLSENVTPKNSGHCSVNVED